MIPVQNGSDVLSGDTYPNLSLLMDQSNSPADDGYFRLNIANYLVSQVIAHRSNTLVISIVTIATMK